MITIWNVEKKKKQIQSILKNKKGEGGGMYNGESNKI